MKNLQDLRIFIETARLGSLSACAKQLNLSPAVVRASIKRLENEISTLLFVRSTRKLRLSEKGEIFLRHCSEAVNLLDNACASLHNELDFTGTIRLSAPSDFGRNVLIYWIDEFMEHHKNIKVLLHFSDDYVDLYDKNIDLAIRYFVPKDSSMIALPLGANNRQVICASPEFLAKINDLKTPQDLAHVNCLIWGDHPKMDWIFQSINSPQEKTLKISVSGNRYSRDGEVLKRWALAGQGLALKSYLDIYQELSEGKLVEIQFTDWKTRKHPLYMVFPERRLIDSLITEFKEFLIKKVQNRLKDLE